MYILPVFFRPLAFQYGTENISNLGPLVRLKAEQQKVIVKHYPFVIKISPKSETDILINFILINQKSVNQESDSS